MGKQYLDEVGLQIVADKVKESISVGSAAMAKAMEVEDENTLLSQSVNNINNSLPYSFNTTSNISNFNRKFVHENNSLSWTATHTGKLTLRLVKHGDGYSLYLGNQNGMLDTYDNFFGTPTQATGMTEVSITMIAWVKKGDVIRLESNLPSSTAAEDMFFCQTGLLAYNNNFD